MRTHIFIVNEETFPKHLQYMFAGTGSKDKDEHPGLLTDISRVRVGDFVIFYIEGTVKIKGGGSMEFSRLLMLTLWYSMPQKKMAFNPAFLKSLFIEHCLNPTKFTLKEYQNGRH
ncbi:hypothetical protein ES705_48225 [subsurface metagenome]